MAKAHLATSAVEVRIWGHRVGAVALDPKAGFYAFAYAPEWLATGIELAPRTMPTKGYREPFIFPNLPPATYHRLPAMLSDALPDDFGNALVNAWMQSHGRTLESITPLDRLAYMGTRGMGALEFKPTLAASRSSQAALSMQALVEGARRAVQGALTLDLAASALTQIIRVGTSAGGARAKAVIAWNPQSGEVRSGQFQTAEGFEHWLLKFDGVGEDPGLGKGRDYGRTEYAYHLMARAAGIRMSDCRLMYEGPRAHFMTRRFDRDGGAKHHLQSLCAMAHLDYKQVATHSYEQAFMVVAGLGLGHDANDELFRRMAFNVMAKNCDDHTKNIAFLLRQGGAWELSPAFDMTYAFNPEGKWAFQHQMSINGKFTGISRDDLMVVAERFGVRHPNRILEVVADAVEAFDTFASEAGLPGSKRDELRQNFLVL